jgi:hypothetical protein
VPVVVELVLLDQGVRAFVYSYPIAFFSVVLVVVDEVVMHPYRVVVIAIDPVEGIAHLDRRAPPAKQLVVVDLDVDTGPHRDPD